LIARYEKLGKVFSHEELDDVYKRFTQLADKKKNIYDQDLLSLLASQNPVAIAA
jgi:2-isopropylmalate synthase